MNTWSSTSINELHYVTVVRPCNPAAWFSGGGDIGLAVTNGSSLWTVDLQPTGTLLIRAGCKENLHSRHSTKQAQNGIVRDNVTQTSTVNLTNSNKICSSTVFACSAALDLTANPIRDFK